VDFLFGDDVSSAVQSCGFVVFAVWPLWRCLPQGLTSRICLLWGLT
jgi:hypothetical protein